MSSHDVAVSVDARNLSCPMPVVRAKQAIDKLNSGQVLELLATDKASKRDIPAWAASGGHQVIKVLEHPDMLKFYIQKG